MLLSLKAHFSRMNPTIIPLHGLIGNGQTRLFEEILLLSLSESLIGRGVGEDGVRHCVRGEALNAVLDVTDRQLGLQEEVELAVRQTYRHVHHPANRNNNKKQRSTQVQSGLQLYTT